MRIKAEARAEANKILSESITEEIINYNKVEKWDGELPAVTGDADPFISLDGLQDDEKDKDKNGN